MLDDDGQTLCAIKDDLSNLRLKDGLGVSEQTDIESLLVSLTASDGDSAEENEITASQSGVLLKPDHPAAWINLAELSGDIFAAEMALKTAQKTVPPLGTIETAKLAKAFAGLGTIGDAQRAIVLAPWETAGWELIRGCAE